MPTPRVTSLSYGGGLAGHIQMLHDLPRSRAVKYIVSPGVAAAYLCVTTGHLSYLRRNGGGPVFESYGSGVVTYRLSDLDDWASDGGDR